VSDERISSGIPRLDAMLAARGISAALRSSSPAPRAPASRASPPTLPRNLPPGRALLYLAFEESPTQIARNMRSIGIDLEPFIKKAC